VSTLLFSEHQALHRSFQQFKDDHSGL